MPYRVLHTVIDLDPAPGPNVSAESRTLAFGEDVPDDVLTPEQAKYLVSVGALRETVPGEPAASAEPTAVTTFPTGDAAEVLELQRALDRANARIADLETGGAGGTGGTVDEDPEDARVTDLLKLTKDELVAACEERGLETSGRKADLAARIANAEFPDQEAGTGEQPPGE
jgi:hypothetical protein